MDYITKGKGPCLLFFFFHFKSILVQALPSGIKKAMELLLIFEHGIGELCEIPQWSW